MKQENRIKKLEGLVIDQIAAGEVIERPSQLVKELIENSLDAGAKSIELSVSSSLAQISVIDDGHGILKQDLPLVFERHSTSKITEVDELFKLSSFGFRGEALSAICSISKISLETKSALDDTGSLYVLESGKKILEEDSEIKKGTKLSISNLFDNVPVRKKFLKSQRYEMTLLKKMFQSFSLLHFDKNFKFKVDGKLLFYFTEADSIQDRYSQIYSGKKIYKISLPVEGPILKGSVIYLEEPGIDSKTSGSLLTYVQSRWIQCSTLAAAVREGLNTYLMHGYFPRGIVDLKLAPDFLDVNVHPMKSEVKYENSSFIYKHVRYAVSLWAKESPWNKDVVLMNKGEASYKKEEVLNFSFQRPNKTEIKESFKAQTPFGFKENEPVLYKRTVGELQSSKIEKLLIKEDGFEPVWSSLMVLGQANLTYIIAQNEDSVYFIDQHAAHERVGYEKLLKSWKENRELEIQNLLIPLSMDLEEEEVEALVCQDEDLKNIGISIERAGPQSIAINAFPGFLKESAVDTGLRNLAKSMIKFGGGSSVDKIFELFFATVSCHSVIRAGHAMSEGEMKLLLLEMDKYKSSYCPHGRPVYKKISFMSLDQDFGRTK